MTLLLLLLHIAAELLLLLPLRCQRLAQAARHNTLLLLLLLPLGLLLLHLQLHPDVSKASREGLAHVRRHLLLLLGHRHSNRAGP